MGEYISMSDALIVTIFSMATVFIVLIMISFLINGLKMIGSKGEKVDNSKKVEVEKQVETKAKTVEQVAEDTIEEELVAVIAAAVAANLGLNIPDIRIKSIVRVPQNSSPWTVAGRRQATGDR